MRIGIIGAGNIGGTLARRLTASGHEVFSDDLKAKGVVMRLVDALGFDPIDAGGLDDSWRQQPGTPVYTKDFDAEGVRRALAEANPERPAGFRAGTPAPSRGSSS
jgi:predicted dinucleotide-binding enzyme